MYLYFICNIGTGLCYSLTHARSHVRGFKLCRNKYSLFTKRVLDNIEKNPKGQENALNTSKKGERPKVCRNFRINDVTSDDNGFRPFSFLLSPFTPTCPPNKSKSCQQLDRDLFMQWPHLVRTKYKKNLL